MAWTGFSQALGSGSGLFGSAISSGVNVKIAREHRDWSEKMANTQFQRAARDLEAAGLNRVLALGQPSPTPSVPVPMMNDLGPTAAQSRLLNQQAKLLQAQTAKTQQEKTILSEKTPREEAYSEMAEVIRDMLKGMKSSWKNSGKALKEDFYERKSQWEKRGGKPSKESESVVRDWIYDFFKYDPRLSGGK